MKMSSPSSPSFMIVSPALTSLTSALPQHLGDVGGGQARAEDLQELPLGGDAVDGLAAPAWHCAISFSAAVRGISTTMQSFAGPDRRAAPAARDQPDLAEDRARAGSAP